MIIAYQGIVEKCNEVYQHLQGNTDSIKLN